MPARQPEAELHDFISEFYSDPLGFCRVAWPWGQEGMLYAFKEPLFWQSEFLEWLGHQIKLRAFDGVHAVTPIRAAVSSGHGIGKGALAGMLTNFIMATRRGAKGVITANTSTQLQDKTWAGITTWTKLSLPAHWFEINSTIMYRKGYRDSWKCSPQTCDPDNSEAFAGQHNVSSTSFYINDEDSNVPNSIHEVQWGGLTDGEPMCFLFGNPTRREGAFYDAVFGDMRHRWKSWTIDSRNVEITNKEEINALIEDRGIDSDVVRVRVLGEAPRASDLQFIDSERIQRARERDVVVLDDEPLVAGCDLAWGGADNNVIRFRRGRDAKSIPPIRIPGELTRDPAILTTRLAEILGKTYGGHKVAMLFLDSAGIAGAVGTRLRQIGHTNVTEVNFGADSPDRKCRFMRDFMWAKMKDWLLVGAIDKDKALERDLGSPGIRDDTQQRIWLESKKDMKKRDVASPDDADALALTFAQEVKAAKKVSEPMQMLPSTAGGWMGG
jgi:hypothetical protein